MALFCRKCGEKLEENAEVCQSCGYVLNVKKTVDNTNVRPVAEKKSVAPVIAVISAVFAMLLCAVTVVVLFVLPALTQSVHGKADEPDQINIISENDDEDDNSPDEKPTNKVVFPSIRSQNIVHSPDNIDLQESESEQKPDPESENTPVYRMFNDYEFNTYCAYPTEFKVVDNILYSDRLRLVSPDNTAEMVVGAEYNIYGLTVEESMNDYINNGGGYVKYSASGKGWYAVSYELNGMIYYRKCFVQDEDIRWFDFSYPAEQDELYDKYINYIEDNFKRNK